MVGCGVLSFFLLLCPCQALPFLLLPCATHRRSQPLLVHISLQAASHSASIRPTTKHRPSLGARQQRDLPTMLPSTPPTTHPAVTAALAYVEQHCKGVDASHDLSHIHRVLALTDRIARAEGLQGEELETTWLCAALHDIGDAKYVQDGADVLAKALHHLEAAGHVTATKAERIQAVVARVSFREELPGGLYTPDDLVQYPELGSVKDADQLDAIGALGVARTFAFGGARGRAFYDMEVLAAERERAENSSSSTCVSTTTVLPTSKEAYTSSASSEQGKVKAEDTLAHFHEKLLHLAGRMKTREGQALAKARHEFMEQFLAQLVGEVWGER